MGGHKEGGYHGGDNCSETRSQWLLISYKTLKGRLSTHREEMNGNGWQIQAGDIIAIWLAMRDAKRSSYVIGIGVNYGVGLGGKFLIALETTPKWALPVERVVVGAGAWGASLWMGAGALGCTSAELEESSARAEKLG